MRRPFLWATLVLATLVVIGIFAQVYFIGAFVRGAGQDALDAHTSVGGIVHGLEILVLATSLAGYWRRWGEVALAGALAVIGTVQVGFADGDRWVGGVHAFLALVVLVLAAVVAHRAVRALGLGRHGEAGTA